MLKKILKFVDCNLRWFVLFIGIGGIILFIKAHKNNTITQIFSLLAVISTIYYFVVFEKILKEHSRLIHLFGKIKFYSKKYKLFIVPIFGIIIICSSYFLASCYYQKKHSPKDLNESLVLYLPLEEGLGDIVYDKSLRENHGKILGNSKWTIGKENLALEFDGVNSYIDLGKHKKPFTNKNYTIAIWVYIKEFPNNNNYTYILWRNDNAPGILFNKDGTKLYFHIDGNYGQSIVLTTTPINYIGKWNHLVMSYDGITGKVYINGELKEKKNLIMNNYLTPETLKLAWDGADNRDLNGRLDEIKIYNMALSSEEIKMLYFKKKNLFIYSSLSKNISAISLIILIIIISYLISSIRKKEKC